MKVFLIGGTGLLGSECAKQLIALGHEVTALALPPVPKGADLPPEMKIEFGSYLDMSDEELKRCFEGCEGFVFAAGVDERVEGPAPIYDMFKKFNITPLERLLRIAKECGVKHTAICGSYFSYFAKIWPEKDLCRWHPYIRSRQINILCYFLSHKYLCKILLIAFDCRLKVYQMDSFCEWENLYRSRGYPGLSIQRKTAPYRRRHNKFACV